VSVATKTVADVRRLLDELPASLRAQLGSSMMRDAVKDRSYRATPLGLEVARYIRWKRNEWGAEETTIRDYEAQLRNLALFFADLELADFQPPVGIERLREALDFYWGSAAPRTRNKVRSCWIDFFEWAIREGRGIYGNPARAIARAKTRDTEKHLFGENFIETVLAAQTYEADWLLAVLILRYAMRRGGVANVRMQHFDWDRRLLTVHTKGGRIHPLPLPDPLVWTKLLALQANGLGPESPLVYRQDTRRLKVDDEQATEFLDLAHGKRQGYAEVTRRNHNVKPTGKLVHLRWYGCLERAGLVPKGTTAGTNMHRGRHTGITAMVRGTHNLKLAQLLAGHKDIRTTAGYADLDTADLEAALAQIYNLGAED
jgi:site-specific recombinase XerD